MVGWVRVLVWFKRKQWKKGCFEHGLVPGQIHHVMLKVGMGAV